MRKNTILLLIAFAVGCSTNTSVYKKLNQHTTNQLIPEHIIHHINNDTSVVYSLINTAQLLYTRKDQSYPFKASAELQIKITNSLGDEQIKNGIYTDKDNNQEPKFIFAKNYFEVENNSKISIEVKTTDLGKNETHLSKWKDLKDNQLSSSFFLIIDSLTGLPLTKSYLKPNHFFKIECPAIDDEIEVKWFESNFNIAHAPHTVSNEGLPELENFEILPGTYKNNTWYGKTPEKKGVLAISHKNIEGAPKFISVFATNFPKLQDHLQMTEALRYITTDYEFKQINNNENVRLAFEEFWKNCTRNPEKAKKLINFYYKRVEEANTFFTTYKEGWKTDKGIIYIVYGKPHQVYNYENAETWIYGDETNPLSLNFTFDKKNNSFSNKDFVLRRSPTYQSSWYVAIERWREGRIY